MDRKPNCPMQPGVVMWPHKDGRHLFALVGGYIVAFWRADKQRLVCDDDHDLGFCASDRVKDLNYIGPCLTTTQIAELLAGERERVIAEAIPKILVDLAELPDRTSPDDLPDVLSATAQEIEQIITDNIRTLGPSP